MTTVDKVADWAKPIVHQIVDICLPNHTVKIT